MAPRNNLSAQLKQFAETKGYIPSMSHVAATKPDTPRQSPPNIVELLLSSQPEPKEAPARQPEPVPLLDSSSDIELDPSLFRGNTEDSDDEDIILPSELGRSAPGPEPRGSVEMQEPPEEELPESPNLIDLTAAEPIVTSRLSSLQAEKIGILLQKVRLLTRTLAENNLSVDVSSLDRRLKRVEDQIDGLDEQPQQHPELAPVMPSDDLLVLSPRKPSRPQIIQIPPSSPMSPVREQHIEYEPTPRQPTQATQAQQAVERSPFFEDRGTVHAWSREVKEVLRSSFGLSAFRHQQRDIVDCTLAGVDCIVLMPTGGGKSLCFQLPALCESGKTRGTTVVISPLISLMQDQVYHLKNRDIEARMINSNLSGAERDEAYGDLASGRLKLVYLSPEMLSMSSKMQNELARLCERGMLARIVIDEAHCVSSWGHDFREDYLKLHSLKHDYKDVPIMALTGTANGAVLRDIGECVRPNRQLFQMSFNRPNIYYEVRPKRGDIIPQIKRIYLENKSRTGIVFCHSQNACEETARKLLQLNVSAGYYHAGLPKETRSKLQEDWQEGKIKIMCATIAFGMGVDKADVRYVVHLTMPRSMEGFYQESGRAGRDGLPSKCFIYYTYSDYTKLVRLIEGDDHATRAQKERNLENLSHVKQYCENTTDCRRQQILQYFDEVVSAQLCKLNCDTCQLKQSHRTVQRDMTGEARQVVGLLGSLSGQRITSFQVIDVLRGSRCKSVLSKNLDKEAQFGASKSDKSTLERLINHLVADKVLEQYSYSASRKAASHTYLRLGARAKAMGKVTMEFLEQHGQRPQSSAQPAGPPKSGPPIRPNLDRQPKRPRFESATQKASQKTSQKVRKMPF